MADPLPAFLKDDFYRLLSRSFPQILVADDVWPEYLKNPSEAGKLDDNITVTWILIQ